MYSYLVPGITNTSYMHTSVHSDVIVSMGKLCIPNKHNILTKPEPIMLSVYLLFLPEFPIIFTNCSYFIPMPSLNIPVIFSKFLLCQ